MPTPPSPGTSSVRELLEQLNEVDQSKAFLARQKLWLVVVPESGAPTCHELENGRALVERLTSLQGQPVNVFVFKGERWNLSRPPYRHLLPPEGTPIPLYMPPGNEIEVDPDGDMGAKPEANALPGEAASGTRPGLAL